jgi:membrane fusion protein (multidrug efflux system)
MRRQTAFGLFAAGGVALLGGLYAFAPSSLPAQAQTQSAPGARGGQGGGVAVEAVKVTVGEVVEDIRAVGTLQANESVVIATEIAGRIAQFRFNEGASVKAGDVLLELDATILKAELDKARSDMTLAAANRERAEMLADKGSGTQRARDEQAAAYRAAQVNLALAEARLQKATITAPFDGVMGLRAVSPGTFVQPGQRIVELAQINPLKVDFRAPETYAPKVRAGQTVLVSSDAAPGPVFEGKIYAIDPSVDVNGRAIRMRANVPNPNGALAPGFFARIRVITEQRPNAVLVPESAIFPVGGRTLVYRVVEGRAMQREVRLGQRTPGKVEIREGLTPDDVVVTSGQQRLRDGVPVNVVNSGSGA